MKNGSSISIEKMGNGFQVTEWQSDSKGILVFESKKKLIRFIDSHFSEKREKKEGKGEKNDELGLLSE